MKQKAGSSRPNPLRFLSFSGLFAMLALSVGWASTCSAATGHYLERGKASWYGASFHNKRTASGELFNQNALTAAHPNLPMGTRLKVTNMANGRSVVVRVNDRGPYTHKRIIDLSKGAAKVLGMLRMGTTQVRVEQLSSLD